MFARLQDVLRRFGIGPGEYPEDGDDLPEFGGPVEEDDGDWDNEFDDDDPYEEDDDELYVGLEDPVE